MKRRANLKIQKYCNYFKLFLIVLAILTLAYVVSFIFLDSMDAKICSNYFFDLFFPKTNFFSVHQIFSKHLTNFGFHFAL